MLHAMSRFFVVIVQRYLPDAYLFAVILTFIAFAAALALSARGTGASRRAGEQAAAAALLTTLKAQHR